MQLPEVAGLTSLEGSNQSRMTGSRFSLPKGFDSDKFASKWEEQGPAVDEAMQPQVLAFANCQAEGWEVYKTIKAPSAQELADAKKAEEEAKAEGKAAPEPLKKIARVPYTRVVGKVVYVLMFRPKELQQALNTLYANQSREMVGNEIVGNTSAANESGDHGILTNQDLRRTRENFEGEAPAEYLRRTATKKPSEAVELHIG